MEVQETLAASYSADSLAKAKELCSAVYFSLVVSFPEDHPCFWVEFLPSSRRWQNLLSLQDHLLWMHYSLSPSNQRGCSLISPHTKGGNLSPLYSKVQGWAWPCRRKQESQGEIVDTKGILESGKASDSSHCSEEWRPSCCCCSRISHPHENARLYITECFYSVRTLLRKYNWPR